MTKRTLENLSKLIFWVLLLASAIIAILAIYGGNQLYYRSECNQQIEDYRFEINSLQTKLHWLQELNDYISAMEQILPPIVLAKLKAAALIIKNEKHKAYERFEQPIITEEEKK